MACLVPVICVRTPSPSSVRHCRAAAASSAERPRRGAGGNVIKVVVNGATSSVGRAAIAAVTKARGMTVAGAVDVDQRLRGGTDAGELAGLEEPLEVPVVDDLVLVLGSLSQSTEAGVMVDFSANAERVVDNVRQATAFGLKSVVYVPGLDERAVGALVSFCAKASTGCVICPTLSIGRVLLQQAAMAAAFHYGSVQVIESSQANSEPAPSSEAVALASSLSGLGREFNEGSEGDDSPARGVVVGDGVRVHSLVMPGPGLSAMDVRLSGPGEALSVKHELGDVSALMPGLLLAIRRVTRLKSLVYGLEKIL